jgi:hypothetical protein
MAKKQTKAAFIGLRVSATLKQALEAKAERNGQSLTTYISELVEEAHPKITPLTTEQLEERLDISPLSLAMSYRDNVDLSDRQEVHSAAQRLATLDPDGIKWYPKALSDSWIWYPDVKQPSDYAVGLKQLNALLASEEADREEPTPPSYSYHERLVRRQAVYCYNDLAFS